MNWQRDAFRLCAALVISGAIFAEPNTHGTPLIDQRGTLQHPVVITGTITTSGVETADASRKEARKELQDSQVADYTVKTGKATIALAIIAVLQAGLFVWQLGYMRKGMARTEASIQAAERSAQAAQDSVALARMNLEVLERPWVVHTQTRVVRREGAPIQPDLINNWYVSFVLKNVGRSPARITAFEVHLIDTAELPETPNYSAMNGKLNIAALLAPNGEDESSQIGPTPEKRPNPLTVYALVSYEALDGRPFQSGFAVEVSPHLPEFSNSKNRAYEWLT